jgi:hypothetical protein
MDADVAGPVVTPIQFSYIRTRERIRVEKRELLDLTRDVGDLVLRPLDARPGTRRGSERDPGTRRQLVGLAPPGPVGSVLLE